MNAPAYQVGMSTRPQSDVEEKPLYGELRQRCMRLVNMSRNAMARYYPAWDRQYALYCSQKRFDSDDEKADKEKKPTKQSVPITAAQVQTFVSFCFLLFTQNDDFFAYRPRGSEGFKVDEDATTILTRDLRKNAWPVLLYEFLLNCTLFNLGVIKHSWVEEYANVQTTVSVPGASAGGFQITDETQQTQNQRLLRYQGNRLMQVSPYRFFPDPNLPLTRFQEGEFCASEDEYTRTALRQMEADGVLLKGSVDLIPDISVEDFKKRGPSRANMFKPCETTNGASAKSSAVIVTEVQIKLIPSDTMIDDKPLGDENFEVMYLVWIANDKTVIRCEPMGYLHGQFTYDVGQFQPSMHELVPQGLAEMTDWLQNVITWLINAHITSVKDSLGGKFVVDPLGIDMRSLDERSAYIMLKKSAMGRGVDTYIKQLQTTDTTQQHMADAQALMAVLQTVTGVNDNMMGQYNSGRRSATEARTVTQGAAGRSKTVATVIWNMAMDPLGQKLLTNARSGMSEVTFAQILIGTGGMRILAQDPEKQIDLQNRFADFRATPEELVANNDFFGFDSTMQSEKGFIAQSLQELLQVLMTNPQAAQLLDIDPAALMKAIQALRGITNLGDFSLKNNPQMQAQMAAAQNNQAQLENGPVNTQPGLTPTVAI